MAAESKTTASVPSGVLAVFVLFVPVRGKPRPSSEGGIARLTVIDSLERS